MHADKSYRDEFHKAGYDFEEEYFHRVNAALIARIRAERAAGVLPPLAFRQALPSPPPDRLEKLLGVIFKPLPTGIYSFPV